MLLSDGGRERLRKSFADLLESYGIPERMGVPARILADTLVGSLDEDYAMLQEIRRTRRAAGIDRHTAEMPRHRSHHDD